MIDPVIGFASGMLFGAVLVSLFSSKRGLSAKTSFATADEHEIDTRTISKINPETIRKIYKSVGENIPPTTPRPAPPPPICHKHRNPLFRYTATCSKCGNRQEFDRLPEKEYACVECGNVLLDKNAPPPCALTEKERFWSNDGLLIKCSGCGRTYRAYDMVQEQPELVYVECSYCHTRHYLD